jgi:DNA polymerase-3 subunit delta'
MKKVKKNRNIITPKSQLKLYGYEENFNLFLELKKKMKLPNTILLSGAKGSGKATFAYHFINYLLSINEENKYSLSDFSINPENKSYKAILNNTHPNFTLIENNDESENIKIDEVRNILKFLSKSTYTSDLKIVLIDDSEFLNKHSSNALLKSLEEVKSNTFFFIIHDSSHKILETIKSRSIEFKFFLQLSQKKIIFENIVDQYEEEFNLKTLDDSFYFETPGNLLRYMMILLDNNIDALNDKLSCILNLTDNYKKNNNPFILTFISLLIEIFYNELSKKKANNLNYLLFNKLKLINEINNVKKFNLDSKSMFISLKEILINEPK